MQIAEVLLLQEGSAMDPAVLVRYVRALVGAQEAAVGKLRELVAGVEGRLSEGEE